MADDKNNSFDKLRAAGFDKLVPIIPPDATLSPGSSIPPSARGKTPGKPNHDGTWAGYDWLHTTATARGFDRWADAGAGVGVVCGEVVGLDIDVDDAGLANSLHRLALDTLGPAPARVGNAPRFLLVYRLNEQADDPGTFPKLHINYNGSEHLIEIRGSGQQFVAYGQHATTGREYTWDRELYDVGLNGLTLATRGQINAFLHEAADLVDMLGGESTRQAGGNHGNRETVDQSALVADDADALAAIIEQIPNTDRQFPERDDYIKIGCAIKAAFANDPDRGFSLWRNWCERWDGGANDPDRMVADWRGMQPPFSIGADYLVRTAAALGVPNAAGSAFDDSAVEDLVEGTDDSNADSEATRNPISALFEDYCYVEGIEQFVDIRHGKLLSKSQFSVRFAGTVGKGTYGKECAAEIYLTDHRRRRLVEGVTFRPKRGLWLTEDGRQVVNLWQPTPAMTQGWLDVEVTDADIAPWLDLIKRHIPDDEIRETVIDWLAWQIQHPGEKCNFHLLWTGDQGVGKDSLIQFLLRAHGEGQFGQATNQPANVLLGDWTDYIEGRSLVVVQEVHTFSRKEVSNSLKPLLACPPNYIQIHKKHKAPYPMPNVVNMIMLSNHDDALALEKTDRRVLVLRSACAPGDFSDDYFQRFHDWLNNGGDRMLTGWMASRDLSEFNSHRKAPMTTAKAQMIGLSMGVVESCLADAIEDHDGLFAQDLLTADELLEWVRNNAPNGQRITSNRLGRVLSGLGCEQVARTVVDSKQRRLWAVRNVDDYRDMPARSLGDAYDMQRRRMLSGAAGEVFERS